MEFQIFLRSNIHNKEIWGNDNVEKWITKRFGCIFMIVLSIYLISLFRGMAALSLNFPPSGGGISCLWGAGYTVQSPGYVEAGQPQQEVRTGLFVLQSLLEDLAYVFDYVFNHWFAHGANRGSTRRGMSILMKEGSRDVWEKQDDYRPITLLNTDLKIFSRILTNHLLIVVRHLIGPCERKINPEQSALNVGDPRGNRRRHKYSTDQFESVQSLQRVEYRFLVTTRFEPEFCKWISLLLAVIWLSCVNLWWGMQCRSARLMWLFQTCI